MFKLFFALIFTDQDNRYTQKSYKCMFLIIGVILHYWLNFGKEKYIETRKKAFHNLALLI